MTDPSIHSSDSLGSNHSYFYLTWLLSPWWANPTNFWAEPTLFTQKFTSTKKTEASKIFLNFFSFSPNFGKNAK